MPAPTVQGPGLVVVPPRCAEVVAPYMQALSVNSHAMMSIFDAM